MSAIEGLAFREVAPSDTETLWQLLFVASHSSEEAGADVQSIRHDPRLSRYVEGWGRRGDLGVLVDHGGQPIGGAWVRLIDGAGRDEPDFVDEETPELAIAVLPGYEGRGIGAELLGRLLAHCEGRFPAVVLSVRASNPARRLYERFGFEVVEVITNRIGGRSVKMLRRNAQ